MKKLIFLFSILFTLSVIGQNSVNQYKYVVVAKKFDFLKKPDQYQTSSLTKFLLNENGFTALLSDDVFPEDLVTNKCLALTAVIKDDSGFLVTKSMLELRDCFNRVVFTSEVGKSRLKDYKRAYHEAIRRAFQSVSKLNYSYTPSTATKKEVKTKITTPVAVKVIPKTKVKTPKVAVATSTSKRGREVLYAQSIANGFQLVNTKPEVVFVILKTNLENVYIIKDKNGILYKKGNSWVAEYSNNSGNTEKLYDIKF